MKRIYAFAQLLRITIVVVGLLVLHLSHGWSRGEELQGVTNPTAKLGFQLGHQSGISDVAISPDGRFVLTAGGDRTARLWDTASGHELRQFTGLTEGGTHAVFSRDGRFVLTADGHRIVRLWDVASGQELRQFTGVAGNVEHVAFSPDGRVFVLTSNFENHLLLLDLMKDGLDWQQSFLKNNNVSVQLWDAESGRVLQQFTGHTGKVPHARLSADCRFVLTYGGDSTVRLWDVASGRVLQQFSIHTSYVDWVTHATLSADGRFVLTIQLYGHIVLWDATSGRELRQFSGHKKYVGDGVFSPDGRFVLIAGGERDRTARLWDTASGDELRQFTGHTEAVTCAVFSPDGRFVLTAGGDRTARLWDTASGHELRQFTGHVNGFTRVTFSSDRQFLLTASEDNTIRLWSTASGGVMQQFSVDTAEGDRVVFSPDGRLVLTFSYRDGTVRLWDAKSGRVLRQFSVNKNGVADVAMSSDGQFVVTVGRFRDDNTARLWDAKSGRVLQEFIDPTGGITHATMSSDGRFVLTVGEVDNSIRLWDSASGQELRQFIRYPYDTGAPPFAIFSPDSRFVLTTNGDRDVRLWDTASGRELRQFIDRKGETDVTRAVFSPDGRFLLTASWLYSTIRLWETASGQKLKQFTGHAGGVNDVTFLSGDRFVISAGNDGTIRLWDDFNGQELAHLVSFRDDTWAVATPEGRFDTNNLEEIKGLHWLMPDDPLRALPLEIFMRDYYEPRLLSKVLDGEKLPTIQSLIELNRAQPKVEIVGVDREGDAQVDPTDIVRVTVQITGTSETFGLEGQQRRMETGAYDLRLFRDGQLVGQWPQEGRQANTVGMSAAAELQQWRAERRVVDLKEGTRQIVFKGIRLPRRAAINEVQFSAYAFNEDRVKSETARTSFTIPPELSPRVPRAYIVSMGVNAFEDPRWDLNFAAKDATQLGTVLTTRLEAQRNDKGQGRYEDVVWIGLTAEAHTDNEGHRQLTTVQARKAQMEAVLKTLAGQPVKADALQGIVHADQLRRANPEDLVILAFSTHGEVDERGRLYLLPHDIGVNPTESERRRRAISSDDLSAWLQGLDAIDLVMIVDACHSAASVQSAEFKPGPMGSRGLGQLAYDKGMRILTATQPDKPAYETQQIGQGVLTYALVREGLEQHKADYKPKDQQIWLSEWLSYAAERVPGLHNEWGREKGKLHVAEKKEADEPPALQQPALFDFARKRDALIGSTTP